MSEENLSPRARDFLKAMEEGFVCLHPSETLPGLSFHPDSELAKETLYRLKSRDALKTVVSLVSSLEKARLFWKPLPAVWDFCLAKLWPAPLTVVWEASSEAPRALVSEKGMIALRSPHFGASSAWMNEVLENFSRPFPSTSVNKSGEPPAVGWEEATQFSKKEGEIFVPSLEEGVSFAKEPSTIILLKGDSFEILRQGALSSEEIEKVRAVF